MHEPLVGAVLAAANVDVNFLLAQVAEAAEDPEIITARLLGAIS